MRTTHLLACLISCLILISSCNSNSGKRGQDGFKFDESSKKSDIEITKSFIYLFPAPGDILDRFQEADIIFNQSFLHKAEHGDKYLNSRDKGLNLGVYVTDMAYSAMFSRSSMAVEYMDVIRKLSTDLSVSTSTFESLIERAKNNVSNGDSLVSISNEVFYNMIEFLENSGKESTIAVISCGAYIESMYIAMNSIEKYKEDDPIIQQITELKYPMENLLGHAETVSDDPNVQSILKYIEELNKVFEDLDREASKVTKSEPGVISLSGGTVPELTEENFDLMKQKVTEIRDHITALQ